MSLLAPIIVEVPSAPGPLDWVIAAATLLAVVVPALLFGVEWRGRQKAEARATAAETARHVAEERYRTEELARLRAKDAEEVAVRERRQAELVYAWPVGGLGDDVRMVYSSRSEMPVSDVEVEGLGHYGWTDTNFKLQSLRLTLHLDLLPPTDAAFAEFPFDDLQPSVQGRTNGKDLMLVTLDAVEFTDADGQHWRRELPGGPLTSLAERVPYTDRLVKRFAAQRARMLMEQGGDTVS